MGKTLSGMFQGYSKDGLDADGARALFVKRYHLAPDGVFDCGSVWLVGPLVGTYKSAEDSPSIVGVTEPMQLNLWEGGV